MAATIPRRSSRGRRGRPTAVKLVPIGPFREAFDRTYRTAEMIAEEMGWLKWEHKTKKLPDVTRVKRTLGITPYRNNRRELILKQDIEEEVGLALLVAMDIDPVDVGL